MPCTGIGGIWKNQRNGAGNRGHMTTGALGDATHDMSARRLSGLPQALSQDQSRRRNARLPAGVAAEDQRMSTGHSAPGRAVSRGGDWAPLGPAPRCSMRREQERRDNGAQATGRASDFATRDSLRPRASATLAIVPSSGFPSPLNAL
jgi:hypothetical protein